MNQILIQWTKWFTQNLFTNLSKIFEICEKKTF